MGAAVTDVDNGWIHLRAEMRGQPVTLDVQSTARNRSMDLYGDFLEEGTERMRARPFMGTTLEQHDGFNAQLTEVVNGVIAGGNIKEEMLRFAEYVIRHMREVITQMGLVRSGDLGKLLMPHCRRGSKVLF